MPLINDGSFGIMGGSSDNVFSKLFSAIGEATGSVVHSVDNTFISPVTNTVTSVVNTIYDDAKSILSGAKTSVDNVIGTYENVVTTGINTIGSVSNNLVDKDLIIH